MSTAANKPKRATFIVAAVVGLVVILDQALKVWVKTHFYLGESLQILPFFELHFIQNNGMAFGWELGSKLLLTVFRVFLVIGLTYYLVKLIKAARVPTGYLISISLIIAGAFGNIIDCVLYGEIFTNPYPPDTAELVPVGQGYGTWFHGLVVDMLYFPLFEFRWPTWIPGLGGGTFSFFDPIFNIADSAITVGMLMVIFFYSKYLGKKWYAAVDEKKQKK